MPNIDDIHPPVGVVILLLLLLLVEQITREPKDTKISYLISL